MYVHTRRATLARDLAGSVNDTSEEKTNVRLQNCKSEESINHETCKRVKDGDQQ